MGKTSASHEARGRDITTVTPKTERRGEHSTLCCEKMHLKWPDKKHLQNTGEDMTLVARARLKPGSKKWPVILDHKNIDYCLLYSTKKGF